jgi:phosphomethylpyrimidine synthase
MATQLEAARQGKITEAMRIVAEAEDLHPEELRALVASGAVAIPANPAPRGLFQFAAPRATGLQPTGKRTATESSICPVF